MTKITKEDVLRVAQLAHLELSDTEVETFAPQLNAILSYVDKLNQLDTTGVEPMSQVTPPSGETAAGERSLAESSASESDSMLGTPLREDVVVPSEVIGEVLAGAPDPDPPYFRVPKVIDR